MADRHNDIIRYKKGEMTPAEMHALERDALNDPFLADALEGFEKLDAITLEKDIVELEARMKVQKKTSFQAWILRIAASLLLVAAGFWMIDYVQKSRTEENLALQNQLATPAVTDSLASQNESLTDTETHIENDSTLPSATKKSGAAEKHSDFQLDLKETEKVAATGPTGSGSLELKPPIEESKPAPSPVVSQPESQSTAILEARKESVAMADEKDAEVKKSRKTVRTITGKVTSSEDGTPIPGVNVVVKGTTQGSITDIQGNYDIAIGTETPTLVFSFIGFQSKEIVAQQNLVNVQLGIDATQLSEVVVVGYGYIKPTEPREPVIKLADPVGGRKAYDNYLKNSLRYPPQAAENKIKGRVTLQFTVRTDGSLDEFNILKGLGFGCDEEVIRLVKEGPKWNPTTEDDMPIESEVRVKVRFSLPD